VGLVGLRYDFAAFVWCFGRVLDVFEDDWAVFYYNEHVMHQARLSNVMCRLQEDHNPSAIRDLDAILAQ
jgi:hypothetical protein